MKSRSRITKGASAAALIAAVSAFAACDGVSPHYVLNPAWNVIPPGPSPVVEETRLVSGVSGVILDGVGRVNVQQGTTESLRVRTQEHILPFIRTEMRGGQLVIGFEEGTSYQGQISLIEFDLTVVNLERAELRGAGSIRASNINAYHLSLVHTGVGSIELSGLAATRLDAVRSGVGDIHLTGAVQQQSIVLGGQGTCDARNLDSAEADVTILAAGSATVRVSDRLDARIEGSGSIYYLGEPVVQRTGQGSGSVEPSDT